MNKQLIFWSGLIGVFLFASASIMGGQQIEGYSPISQYISESYATGVPNSNYLRYMYMASGVLLSLFALTAPSRMPKSGMVKTGFVLFAIFYGMGTIVTGFFPCDLGCPSEVNDLSISQFIHNTVGFLTYAFVPICLIGLGISFRRFSSTKSLGGFSLLCGMIALVFVILLFGNPTGPLIGIIQRVIEISILAWVIYCSFFIVRNSKEQMP
jgi:hypothetical protein